LELAKKTRDFPLYSHAFNQPEKPFCSISDEGIPSLLNYLWLIGLVAFAGRWKRREQTGLVLITDAGVWL